MPRARRHVYRALRPGGGGPADPARMASRGWLTAPTVRPTRGGGPRAPAPTAPASRRRNVATGLAGLPLVWSTGGRLRQHTGVGGGQPGRIMTSASTLSHRVHRGAPRSHPRYHQAPGSGSVPLGRKWRKPRHGPRRRSWRRLPHGQAPDDRNWTGRGLFLRRQAPFEADGDFLAQATCGAQGQRPPRPEMGTP